MIVIIKQAPSFLCNDNHGSNRVRIDYQKNAQKATSLPHSKPKWYSYPTAPVECGCRATWSELGDISEGEKRTVQGDQSRSARPASIANGVPFAAENGRTRAPFWFAGKRLASFAPAIPHRTGSARRFFGICCDVSRGVFPWEFQKSRRLF